MPVGELPILEIIIRQLYKAGFTRIEIATGHLSALIQAYFGEGKRFGVPIAYHFEDDPAGTAGPLALLEAVLDDQFLIMNGDVLTDLDFAAFLQRHRSSQAMLTAATCRRSVTLSLGAIMRDSEGAVTDYVEKPTYDFECSAGIYAARREAIAYIERGRRFDFPELVRAIIAAGKPVRTFPIPGFWLDIGTPEDYRCAIEQHAAHFAALVE